MYGNCALWSSKTWNHPEYGAAQFVINEEPAILIRDERGKRVWNGQPAGNIYKNVF